MSSSTVSAEAAVVNAGAALVTAGAEVFNVLPSEVFLTQAQLLLIFEELNEQINYLRAKVDDCKNKAQDNLMSMNTSHAYKNFISRFSKIDVTLTRLLPSYAREIQNISSWDIPTRKNLGSEMKNYLKRIEQLNKELNEMGDILVPKPPKQPDRIVKIHTAPDIEGFNTLKKPLKEILSLLKCGKEIRGIQIEGPVGIGKTTIMQNLNNHEEVANMFEIVIWLNVSSDRNGNKKNFGVEKLQRDLLKRLNVNNADTIQHHQYTQKILEKLNDKKYLLLLDDVKEYLDIDEIGFPNNWDNGSKIVLTTRSRYVCPLIVDHEIKVNFLSEKEARKMFSNLLKPKDFRDDPNIMKVMRQVVDWCGGYPFVIKIVAGYFKLRDNVISWKNGLNNLKSWPEDGDDYRTEMCKVLSFCCADLKDAEKKCFYYGALYPEGSNIYIDRLLDCWTAEKFFRESKSVRADAYCILERLNHLYLLEEDERKICVSMHKLIRLVALHNLSTDVKQKCLVISNEVFADQQNMDSWNDKIWISSTDNKSLKTFPSRPLGCSTLSTLFLQGNSNMTEFPSSFFDEMGNLCVLDLMGTAIESLPDSLMKATNLEVLYLNGCTNLSKLPSEIGNLKRLEVLDISGSGVATLPPQIKDLTRLKRLLVSLGANSEKDSCNVLSNIAKLQELVLDTKSEKGNYNWGIIGTLMENVKSLEYMTSLQFRFLADEIVDVIKVADGVKSIYAPKEENYFERAESPESSSYKVFIQCPISPDVKIPKSQRFERYVEYCNGNGKGPTILKLPSKADSLVINNHYDLEHLSEFESSSLQEIKGCLLENCNKVKIIVDHYTKLINLERLYLNNLPELESLWGGALELDSLPKLKTLKLSRCPKVIMIITQAAVNRIIISSQHSGQQPRAFPDLKKVILVEMQQLTSIWENNLLEWPSLKTLEIRKCPALSSLHFSKDNAIKLTSITTEKVWWEALQWKDDAAKNHFQQYCTFVA